MDGPSTWPIQCSHGAVRGPYIMFGLSNGGTNLKILIRKSQGITILDLRGKSTFGNSGSEMLSAELRRLSDDGVNNFLLNVEKLTQVDSSCIDDWSLSLVIHGRESKRTY